MAVWGSEGPRGLKESVYLPKELWQSSWASDISKGFLGETVIRPWGTVVSTRLGTLELGCSSHVEAGSLARGESNRVGAWWWLQGSAGLYCSVIPFILSSNPNTGQWDLYFFYMKILKLHRSRHNSLVNSPDFKLPRFSIFTASIHFFSLSILKQMPHTVSFLPCILQRVSLF